MLFIPRDSGKKFEELSGPHEYMANHRVLWLYGGVYSFPERSDTFSASHIADSMLVLDMISHDPIWLIIQSP